MVLGPRWDFLEAEVGFPEVDILGPEEKDASRGGGASGASLPPAYGARKRRRLAPAAGATALLAERHLARWGGARDARVALSFSDSWNRSSSESRSVRFRFP